MEGSTTGESEVGRVSIPGLLSLSISARAGEGLRRSAVGGENDAVDGSEREGRVRGRCAGRRRGDMGRIQGLRVASVAGDWDGQRGRQTRAGDRIKRESRRGSR